MHESLRCLSSYYGEGNFSNDDADGSENITFKIKFASFQTSSRLFQIALKVKCTLNFLELNSWRTHPSLEREKKLSSRVSVLHKTCHQEISRPSREVTAKKCTKKSSPPLAKEREMTKLKVLRRTRTHEGEFVILCLKITIPTSSS